MPSSSGEASPWRGGAVHGSESHSPAPRRPIVCLVTDRRSLQDPGRDAVVHLVRAASAGGVDLVQLREPDLRDGELFALTRDVLRAAAGTSTAVVVNDRTDVALAAGAHGVHLRGSSADPHRVRSIVPDGFLIGRSVHGPGEAAAGADADYLVMGTIFRTVSKPGLERTAGVEGLAAVCRMAPVPVLAIGGVTADNVSEVAATGAAGIAAIGLFADAFNATPAANRDAALAAVIALVRHALSTAPGST